MKQNPMLNPRLLAHAVNQQLVPQRVDLARVYRSLENSGISVQISFTGARLMCRGQTIYEDGIYIAAQARGREQCAQQRLRQVKMLKWAMANTPTKELKAIEGWINGQLN